MNACLSPPRSYGGAGAVWDVWRHDDVDGLRAYVQDHVSEFVHHGQTLSKEKVRRGANN